MKITENNMKYYTVYNAIRNDDPMLAVISFDGKQAYVSHFGANQEHYILLCNVGLSIEDINKYFRIFFNSNGAEWTFICPSDYKKIENKERRIKEFYKDGNHFITEFLTQMGYDIPIQIPKCYSRHFNEIFS